MCLLGGVIKIRRNCSAVQEDCIIELCYILPDAIFGTPMNHNKVIEKWSPNINILIDCHKEKEIQLPKLTYNLKFVEKSMKEKQYLYCARDVMPSFDSEIHVFLRGIIETGQMHRHCEDILAHS